MPVVLNQIFRDDEDRGSEMSLSSQSSYDPLHPNFHNKDGEIGSTRSTRDQNNSSSDVVLLTHRLRQDPGTNHRTLVNGVLDAMSKPPPQT